MKTGFSALSASYQMDAEGSNNRNVRPTTRINLDTRLNIREILFACTHNSLIGYGDVFGQLCLNLCTVP
jgi:hypothetical protein